jgi:hypothetical protein
MLHNPFVSEGKRSLELCGVGGSFVSGDRIRHDDAQPVDVSDPLPSTLPASAGR